MAMPAIEPKPQAHRKPDYAVFLVFELLAKHPEYSRREMLVALFVAKHMRRHDDGWYHAHLGQGVGRALSKATKYKRGALHAALKILSAEGGIFRCVPRYNAAKRHRVANDYILIEHPRAYAEAKQRPEGEVVAFTAAKQAALELCREYAEWYAEFCHGAAYEASRKDRSAAMLMLREYPDREYLRELLRAYLAPENDKALAVLPGHQARLLCDARRYLKLADQLWRENGVDFVPTAPDPAV